jgi:hypothetical protein
MALVTIRVDQVRQSGRIGSRDHLTYLSQENFHPCQSVEFLDGLVIAKSSICSTPAEKDSQ